MSAITSFGGVNEAMGEGSTSSNWQSGFDPSYADPRGRMYYATIRYAFK